jgi:uncharacterized membrane protein
MVYSVIGWLWETPFVSINQKQYTNRGFLYGPYVTIYAVSCVSVHLSMLFFNTYFDFTSPFIILIQIIYIALITAIWEYVTSWALEIIFKTRWWDYSYKKYNLNGRISLSTTLFFGVGGFILWKFVNPALVNLSEVLNVQTLNILVAGFVVIYLIDSVITLIQLFELKSKLKKLSKLPNLLGERAQNILKKSKWHKHFIKRYPSSKSSRFKRAFLLLKNRAVLKDKKEEKDS